MKPFERVAAALLVLATLAVLSGCGSNAATGAGENRAQAATATAAKRFSERGPYPVGVATLKLSDRSVEVYYPARKGSTTGLPSETYLQTDPIPQGMLAMLPKIPAGVDLTVTIPATRDAPAAADGPFPLIIFSHGAGGWRSGYGSVLSGIASWGFVIASTDYVEYGFVSQFSRAPSGNLTQRRASVATAVGATLDLMSTQTREASGRFSGVIDLNKIGAIGHSAGGGTMFGELNDPRIRTIVGWAPVPPPTPVASHTPTLIIAGENDSAISPATIATEYDSLQTPKRLVVIANLGHNAFSDSCLAIRGGNDLVGLAKQLGMGIPQGLLDLARNGCTQEDLDTQKGWSIIQHFTVAELRTGLGIDARPRGLGPASAHAFPGVTLSYREQLK